MKRNYPIQKIKTMKLYVCVLAIFVTANTYSQSFKIQNSKFKYDILKTSTQSLKGDTVVPAKYLIDVNIPLKEKKRFKLLSKVKWIKLLSNPKTDWAANLILYDLYSKDAIEFAFVILNREKWILLQKEEDLAYWSSILK